MNQKNKNCKLLNYKNFYSPEAKNIWFILLSIPFLTITGKAFPGSAPKIQSSYWGSPRAAALGGALSANSDDVDAPWHNPATIGGTYKKSNKNFVHSVGFPLAVVEQNSRYIDFSRTDGTFNSPLAEAIQRTSTNQTIYNRISLVPHLSAGFSSEKGRFFLGYLTDRQMAVTPSAAVANSADAIDQTQHGPIAGFSISDSSHRFYFGFSAASLSRELLSGTFLLSEIADTTTRTTKFKAATNTYSGINHSAGLLWKINAASRTKLALTGQNIGGSTFTTSETNPQTSIDVETINLALSSSVKYGFGFLNYGIEAKDLSHKTKTIQEKLVFNSELTFGNTEGSQATFSIRTGYNHLGGTAGLGMKIGALNTQISQYKEDIGNTNEKVLENRTVGLVIFNLSGE